MVNFVICDDNDSFLSRLKKTLELTFIKYNFEARVSLAAKSSDEVLEFLNDNQIHVLILDIDLKSSLSGIQLAQKVREINKNVYIIFITGHLEYILQAYKVKTFDFLPKPVTVEKIEETLQRLFQDINIATYNYINISNKVFLNTDDINYIRKEGMKIIFHTRTREYHDIDGNSLGTFSQHNNLFTFRLTYVFNEKPENMQREEYHYQGDNPKFHDKEVERQYKKLKRKQEREAKKNKQ